MQIHASYFQGKAHYSSLGIDVESLEINVILQSSRKRAFLIASCMRHDAHCSSLLHQDASTSACPPSYLSPFPFPLCHESRQPVSFIFTKTAARPMREK